MTPSPAPVQQSTLAAKAVAQPFMSRLNPILLERLPNLPIDSFWVAWPERACLVTVRDFIRSSQDPNNKWTKHEQHNTHILLCMLFLAHELEKMCDVQCTTACINGCRRHCAIMSRVQCKSCMKRNHWMQESANLVGKPTSSMPFFSSLSAFRHS